MGASPLHASRAERATRGPPPGRVAIPAGWSASLDPATTTTTTPHPPPRSCSPGQGLRRGDPLVPHADLR